MEKGRSATNDVPPVYLGRTVFGDGELQPNQREAIAHVLQRLTSIRASLRAATPSSPGAGPWFQTADRPTQVFSIFGDRGQGKTSTIVSLCKLLSDYRENGNETSPYLVVPMLEPEVLWKDGEIFHAIAFNLLTAIREHSESSNGLLVSRDVRTALEHDLGQFVKASSALSPEGRRLMLEMAGDQDVFAQDMAKRLRERASVIDRLFSWITRIADAAKKDLIIVPIDDIDICRERCEDILHALRLYFSHPRVIVLLAAEFTTIRRAIRNRLLNDLPDVFTGGEVQIPETKERKSTRNPFFGVQREQVLARELRADDEYAQNFLYKIAPPAFRIHLRGLSASERLTVTLSNRAGATAGEPGPSVASLLSRAPSLFDVMRGPNLPAWHELKAKLTELMDAAQGHVLQRLITDYPDVLSPTLRILINQLLKLEEATNAHRNRVVSVLRGDVKQPVARPQTRDDAVDRQVGWPLSCNLKKDASDAHRLAMDALKDAEDEFLMNLIGICAFTPEIERDRHLFYSHRHRGNALEARTFTEFVSMLGSVACSGSGMHGFIFSHKTPEGGSEELSDASNALLNLSLEYCRFRSESIWEVARNWNLDVENTFSTEWPRMALLQLIRGKKLGRMSRTGGVSGVLARSLSGSLYVVDATSTEEYGLQYRPADVGPPAALSSIREASKYRQANIHVSDLRAEEALAARVAESYRATYRFDTKQDGKVGRPSTQSALESEAAMALRLLGAISYRGIRELTGIMLSVCKPPYKPEAILLRGQRRTDLPWLVANMEEVGWVIRRLVGDDDRPVVDRMVFLMYIAQLPLAPLLTAWKQVPEKGEDAASVITAIVSLLGEIRAEFKSLRVDVNLVKTTVARGSVKWKLKPGAKVPVEIRGLENVARVPPELATLEYQAPRFSAVGQTQALPQLVETLLLLQGVDDHASHAAAPTAWIRFVKRAVSTQVIAKGMNAMTHLAPR